MKHNDKLSWTGEVCDSAVVEALRYKPEGRGFDSRCSNWIFSLT
jgi:hypothetical protein